MHHSNSMEYTACLDLFARATLQASNRGFLYLGSRSLGIIGKTWAMMIAPPLSLGVLHLSHLCSSAAGASTNKLCGTVTALHGGKQALPAASGESKRHSAASCGAVGPGGSCLGEPPRCTEYCRAILLAQLHQSPHAVTSRHLPEGAASSLHGCKRTAPELATAPELCKGRLSHLSLRANPLHNPLKLPPEMAWKTLVSGLALAAAIVNALPAPSSHIVHERRDSLHPRWLKRDRVPSHKKLPMRIGLTQSNLDQGS